MSPTKYFTLAGSLLLQIIVGCVYSNANLQYYMTSYWKRFTDSSVSNNDTFYFNPTSNLFTCVALWISGYLSTKIKFFRISIILGAFFNALTYFLLYFTDSYWMAFFAFQLQGIGIGLIILESLKNTWRYFPDKKGLISGIMNAFIGVGGTVFNLVSDRMFNPEGIEAEEIGKEKFYPTSIAQNFNSTCLALFILTSSLGISGNILITEYPEEEEETQTEIEESTLNPIKDQYFYKLLAISLFSSMFPFGILFIVRRMGVDMGIDEFLISVTLSMSSLVSSAVRIGWGYLFDNFDFRKIMFFHSSALVGVAVGYYYFASQGVFYFLLDIVMSSCLGGLYTLFKPQICKVYGYKQASQLFSAVNLCFSVGSFIASIVLKHKLKSIDDYSFIFVLGGAASLVSLVVSLFLRRKRDQEDLLEAKLNE